MSLFNLESDFQNLFRPYTKEGKLSISTCSEEQRQALRNQVIKRIHLALSSADAPGELVNIKRKWALCCHPDRQEFRDYETNGQVVLSANLMAEMDVFFTENINADKTNQGSFFILLNEAQKCKNKQQDALDDISEKIYDFLGKHKLVIIENNQLVVRPLNEIYIDIQPGDKACYAGDVEAWLKYNVQNLLYQELVKMDDEKNCVNVISQILKDSDLLDVFSQQDDPQDLLSSYLMDVYNNGQYQKPVAPELMTPGDAMIKYHLQIALQEVNKLFSSSRDKTTIEVRSFVGKDGEPFTYEAYSRHPYDQYQTYLSLLQSIFAAPLVDANFTVHNQSISAKASAQYSAQQHKRLLEIFDKNAPAELLEQFGLNAEKINIINTKLSDSTPWNWLKENTNWIYAHGVEATIPNPWAVNKDGNIRAREYHDQYFRDRFDKLCSGIEKSSFVVGLNRFPKIYKGLVFGLLAALIIVPILAVGFELLPFMSVNAQFVMEWAALGLFGTSISSMVYGFSESFLDNLSRISEPRGLPSLTWMPSSLRSFYHQIISPMLRIVLSPVDEHYQGKTRLVNQLLYPARIILGLSLSAATAASFIGEVVVYRGIKNIVLGYFAIANLPYDLPIYASAIRRAPGRVMTYLSGVFAKNSTDNKEHKADNSEVSSMWSKFNDFFSRSTATQDNADQGQDFDPNTALVLYKHTNNSPERVVEQDAEILEAEVSNGNRANKAATH